MKDLIVAFLPITTQQYWFFTAYFAMFLVSPMINMFVHHADRKMIGISYAVILLFSFLTLKSDLFFLHKGYSFLWFTFVYFVGATMKKYQFMQKLSTLKCILLLSVTLLITWLPKMTYLFYQSEGLAKTIQNCLISYCSPTILFMAVLTLELFQRIRMNAVIGKVVMFFSTSAFSVYLIHDNRHIRSLCIENRFSFLNELNSIVMIGVVLLCALAIYLACTLLDKVRICLFKLLRIEKCTEMLERLVKRIYTYCGEKLCKKF
jgi:surface polysaccharide O-acyltransferase-like enzyme